MAIDALDRKIIAHLANDSRMSLTALSDEINLSVSATAERVRRLVDSGTISSFTITVDPTAIGRPIEALVEVRMAPSSEYPGVEAALVDKPAITAAYHVTGRFDLILHVAVADVAELNDLLFELKSEFGAEETNTRIILESIEGFPRNPALVLATS